MRAWRQERELFSQQVCGVFRWRGIRQNDWHILIFIEFSIGTPCRFSHNWVHYQYSGLAKLQNTRSFLTFTKRAGFFGSFVSEQIACKTPFSTKKMLKKNQGFQNLLKPVISQFLHNSLFMLYKAIWWEVQGWLILDYFAHLRTHLIFSNLFTKNVPYTFMRVFRNIQAPRRTKEQEQRALQTPRHSSLYLFPFTYSFCIFPGKR